MCFKEFLHTPLNPCLRLPVRRTQTGVNALRHIVTPARQSFGRGRCTPKHIIFTILRGGMDKLCSSVFPAYPPVPIRAGCNTLHGQTRLSVQPYIFCGNFEIPIHLRNKTDDFKSKGKVSSKSNRFLAYWRRKNSAL